MTESEIREHLGKLWGDYQYYTELSAMLFGKTYYSWELHAKDNGEIIQKIFMAGYEMGKESK